MHPPPPSSFQPTPSSFQSSPCSLQHTQQYLNQNIAHNWAISPNLGRKIKSCPFWLKIGTLGILEVLIPNPELDFDTPTPKPIFAQIWAQKFKVVRFVWKLVHLVFQGCWFWIQTLIFEIFDRKIHFWANFGPKTQSWPFCLKIGTHMVSQGCWFLFQH